MPLILDNQTKASILSAANYLYQKRHPDQAETLRLFVRSLGTNEDLTPENVSASLQAAAQLCMWDPDKYQTLQQVSKYIQEYKLRGIHNVA